MQKRLSVRKRRYANEFFQRIVHKPGVSACVVSAEDGTPLRSTIADKRHTLELVGQFGHLLDKALKAVRLFDGTDELVMLRIRSRANEVLVTPDKDFVFLVVQDEVGQ